MIGTVRTVNNADEEMEYNCIKMIAEKTAGKENVIQVPPETVTEDFSNFGPNAPSL